MEHNIDEYLQCILHGFESYLNLFTKNCFRKLNSIEINTIVNLYNYYILMNTVQTVQI